ncbi:MAG TPA: hypothetical protein VLD59_10090 [Steroidobacteraceae bacterium]|nr:hypothetical protein [Steroidobacteraceae bacterium]
MTIGWMRVLILSTGLFATLPLYAAEDLRAALAACRAEQDDAKRLACYDRQADQLSPATTAAAPSTAPSTAPVTATPAPATAPEAAPAVAAAAGTAAAATATTSSAADKFGYSRGMSPEEVDQQNKSDKAKELDEISATVTQVVTQPRGELIVTLDNGQVWAQKVADSRLRLKAGDQVKIRSGALGAYYLSLGSSDRKTRVSRVR